MSKHDNPSRPSANPRRDHQPDSKHRSSTPSDSRSSAPSNSRGSKRSSHSGARSDSIQTASSIQSRKKTQTAKPPDVIHQADPAEQPQVGPQSSCTPTTTTWQGSTHGGPATDHIDWTIDGDCKMTVTGGSLSQNYYYMYLPWLENGYFSKVASLSIGNLTLQPGVTSMYCWFGGMTALSSVSAPNLDTSHITNMQGLFDNCSNLLSVDLTGWKTGNVTTMLDMFYGTALNELDMNGWDISKVTDTREMFLNCNSLKKLKMTNWTISQASAALMAAAIKMAPAATNVDLSHLNGGNTTSLNGLFQQSNASTTITEYDLTGWNLPHIADLGAMFYNNRIVTTIKMDHWTLSDTPTSMGYMFGSCTNLEKVTADSLDTSHVTNMGYMFDNCQKLGMTHMPLLSNWDTKRVTDMSYMFSSCSSIFRFDLTSWDVRSVISMHGMFYGNHQLLSLDLSTWHTTSLTDTNCMFQNNWSLATLDLSGWDTSHVTDSTDMFDRTNLQRIRLGANTGKLNQSIRTSVFPTSPIKTIYAEGTLQPTTFPDGSTTYALPHFQSNGIPSDAFTTAVTQPTWFGVAKIGIQYTHADGTVGDYPHPCLDWTGAGTCTVARSTGLTGSPSRRLSWIDTGNTAHIPGDTLTQDGFLTVTPQWNPMPVPTVATVTWPHDMGGGSKSIRATGTATDLRSDDTIPVRFTWTDTTSTEQHTDTTATIDGSDWTADLTDTPSFASIKAADKIGTGTKVTVTARVKDAGGPLGYWSAAKDGNADMVAPGLSSSYANSNGAGGIAMSSDRSQAVAEPGDTLTISWLDDTDTPISWPDGGGTTTTLTVTAGPGGRFTATKPIAVTGAKKVQYTLSDGINTSEPVTKKITDPITAIPLTGGEAQVWSKLLLILLAVMLIGATTTLRNRRNHGLRLVTNGHTMPTPHGLTTNGHTVSGPPASNRHAGRHTTNHHSTSHQSNNHNTSTVQTSLSKASTAPSHAKLHHAAKHTSHGPRHTK
ncbi:BspA family leucine-rich repeat surface protein [Bifidobacterium sp. ESL0790]|uniref:BspA family leucine-rich repeat surface protein n=1 Tax=Bifidobacterium sp. ESL0790 TaxID=2983233 RepID=UPI0023F63EF8|nr:BspA family leucine-rich repeat surface protein [Bifidobacterium sp. ESL0790]WEV72568.1 BspA family leucine-rich repeat surface protein [Bifidobacterium sp. ESL0790]